MVYSNESVRSKSGHVDLEQVIIFPIRRGCLGFIFIEVKYLYIDIATALIFGSIKYSVTYLFLMIVFGAPSFSDVLIMKYVYFVVVCASECDVASILSSYITATA